MALMTGIDLSFFKDEGFKKFVVILLYMVGVIVFTARQLIPVGTGMEQLGIAAGAYVVINLGGRMAAAVQAGRDAKTVANGTTPPTP